MHEAHEHPPRDQRGLRGDDRVEQRRGTGARRRPPPGWCRSIAWSASRRSRSRSPVARAYWKLPTRRWLLATRASTAPGSTCLAHDTARRSRTTARARVVGTPSACIASLTTYSRSIGPTAASPSPPRANGVRPDPLRCRSRSAAVDVHELAQQQGASVPEPRRVPAELVTGVGLRHRRRRPRGRDRRRAAATPSGLRSHAGSSPSSSASQRVVEHEQARVRGVLGLPGDRHLRQVAGEAVVQDQGWRRGDAHPSSATWWTRRRPARTGGVRTGRRASRDRGDAYFTS